MSQNTNTHKFYCLTCHIFPRFCFRFERCVIQEVFTMRPNLRFSVATTFNFIWGNSFRARGESGASPVQPRAWAGVRALVFQCLVRLRLPFLTALRTSM